MRIDYSESGNPKYLVGAHSLMYDDFYYFDSYREAKDFFNKLKVSREKGTRINLYDIKKDIRKESTVV